MQNNGVFQCFFYALIASIGGLLFGYNTSVISGALIFLQKDFPLTTLSKEFIVSSLLIGAFLGAFFGGYFTEKGRKKALFLTCALFTLGCILFISAQTLVMILIGRFIGGLGLGLASFTVPLYIAEISPPQNRGAFVSLNQLAITMGILLGYLMNFAFSLHNSWRAMVAFQLVFLLLFFLLLWVIPETPSFLASLGRIDVAQKLREKLGHTTKREEGTIATKRKEKEEQAKLSRLLKKPLSFPFLIGVCLSIFQQITGINTVIYYAPYIFQQAGLQSDQSALLATLGVGLINILATIVSIFIIDKWGRKPLILLGTTGMSLSLVVLGFLFHINPSNAGNMAICSVFCYVIFFAIGLGPVTWLIISEIFPLEIRAKAMGYAVGINWICNVFVSLTFLTLLETLSPTYTFYLYAFISVIAVVFIYFNVLETKGKTFEEIQKLYLRKNTRNKS